jgi:hypothetical protein
MTWLDPTRWNALDWLVAVPTFLVVAGLSAWVILGDADENDRWRKP